MEYTSFLFILEFHEFFVLAHSLSFNKNTNAVPYSSALFIVDYTMPGKSLFSFSCQELCFLLWWSPHWGSNSASSSATSLCCGFANSVRIGYLCLMKFSKTDELPFDCVKFLMYINRANFCDSEWFSFCREMQFCEFGFFF